METWAEVALFAVGTMGFWVLCVVSTILLLLSVEFEKPGWATMMLILVGISLAFFGDFNAFRWVADHPGDAILGFAGYVVIGVAWSFCKWWFFVHRLKHQYEEARTEFLRSHRASPDAEMPDVLLRVWRDSIPYEFRDFPPKARNNRSRILMWMMYWPWSAVWTIINDPIRRLFRAIYERIQGAYERIAQRIFSGFTSDFRSLPPTAQEEDDAAPRHDRRAV